MLIDGDRVTAWFMWCPGCGLLHRVNEDDGQPHSEPVWTVTDKTEASFTCDPSILVQWTHAETGEQRCHSFVRGGRWEFLADSTHNLAGQSVPLVDLPEWFTKESEAL